MKLKNHFALIAITFALSFLLQGIIDQNVFKPSEWRQNNIVNVFHFWLTFLSTYYVFSLTIDIGLKKFQINSPKKLILLLVVTLFIALVWVLLTDILFLVAYYKVKSLSETNFFELDLPLAVVILSIGSFYFYQKHIFKTISKVKQGETEKEAQIEVYRGAENLFIKSSDISLIFLSEKLVWLQTKNQEIYTIEKSIAQLTEKLPSQTFFRINRQSILSRNSIKGFEKLEFQKLEVILNKELKKDINLIVSKYNAPIFKKWLVNN